MIIALELGVISQDIEIRIVGNVLNNIPPPNIFGTLLLPAIFLNLNCQAAFGHCVLMG